MAIPKNIASWRDGWLLFRIQGSACLQKAGIQELGSRIEHPVSGIRKIEGYLVINKEGT
jgi:hypothetical protein